jgi:AbiV family abortive infection protein
VRSVDRLALMAKAEKSVTVSAGFAREFWRALLTNATELLEDAGALYARGSFGRARALAVLAREEIGKSSWVGELAAATWTTGEGVVELDGARVASFTWHHPKLVEAELRGIEAARFFGPAQVVDDDDLPGTLDEQVEMLGRFYEAVTEGARGLNLDKQSGFYVDADFAQEQTMSPGDVPSDGVAELIVETARMGEMLLVADHTRMKFEGADVPYDGTQGLQVRLLAVQDELTPEP